jgi:Tol biopolymer transport system component
VDGYVKPDGTRQRRAVAFQGTVVTENGNSIAEVFLVDLPGDLTQPGDGPLAGTPVRRPFPPRGVTQRRLTFTQNRQHPGLQGPRHWLKSSPDGSRIAFLMKDDAGIVQLFTISPHGGEPTQLTHIAHGIASAFTWSPDGRTIAHVLGGSVCLTDTASGQTRRLTERQLPGNAPRPEACVYSPDGQKIAYVKPVIAGGSNYNQIFTVPSD